jgi:hypothetical protein
VAADAQVSLEVLLKAAGIKPTTAQLKKLNTELQRTATGNKKISKTTNEVKRNLEGTYGRSGSAGKDFSRMSQGMGGLVQAYATVAANVFALSSAFLVLRRAADLSSMIKSAEDFSNRFGVSVTRITMQMQEAAGGALSFAEALPTINKAVSAGVGIEQMEKLTVAATKAAQTFGGSATEALNRFISAAQRGRVEIIQTLGVVIKTEQAYKDYAAQIGKTALELSAVDRQQAILNATIAASEIVFAGIKIDPNPFQQLLTTLTDVKDTVLTFITDGVTPMINAFNQSRSAAAALIAMMLKLVGGKIFGQVAIGIAAAAKAGQRSTIQARAAEQKAIDTARRRDRRITVSIKAAKKEAIAFENSLKKQEKAHASFTKKILIQEKGLNIGVATERRAALARNIKSLEGGGKAFAGLPGLEASKRQLLVIDRLLISVAGNAGKTNQSMANMGKTLAATTTKGIRNLSIIEAKLASMRARSIAVGSAFKSGFAQGFQIAEGRVVKSIKGMTVAWRIFFRDFNSGAAKAKANMINFSSAIGRTTGIMAAGFSKLFSLATSFFLIWTIGAAIWEKFGDDIRGISKEQRILLASLKELGEEFDVITKRTDKFTAAFDSSIDNMAKFVSNMEFVRGTVDSTLNTFRNFRKETALALNLDSLSNLDLQFASIIGQIAEFERRRSEIDTTLEFGDVGSGRTARISTREVGLGEDEALYTFLSQQIEGLKLDAEDFVTLMKAVADEHGPKMVKQFASINNLFSSQGLTGFSNQLSSNLLESFQALDSTREKAGILVKLLQAGADAEFFKQLENLTDIERGEVLARIGDTIEEVGVKSFSAAQNFVAAGKSLIEANANLDTYFSGIDKLKAASVPNKEIFNFLLTIDRALNDLKKAAEGSGADTRLGEVVTGDDLVTLQKFIGVAAGDSLQKAITATTNKLEIYKRLIDDSIEAAGKLKIEQAKILLLKAEEASTDERRLERIKEINQHEQNQASLTLTTASITRRVLEENLENLEKAKQQNTFAFRSATVALELAVEQEKIENQKLKTLRANLDFQREQLVIIKESLTAAVSVNAELLKQEKISLKLVTSLRGSLSSREQINQHEQRALELKKAQIKLELQGFEINKNTTEQDLKRQIVLEQQLVTIEKQTALLERQQESRQALDIEREGTTVFSERGIAQIALFMRRALEKEIPKLKSSFEILGEGFTKTIIDTFDTVIDNLLEGGKNFGEVVKEALKASLRDVIGNALKNDMKSIFIEFKEILSTGKPVVEEPLTALSGQTALGPSTTTTVLDEMFAVPPAIEQFQTTMTDAAADQISLQTQMRDSLKTIAGESALLEEVDFKGDLKRTPLTVSKVETVDDSPTTNQAISQMGNLVTAASEGNTQGMLQGLISLGSTIVTAILAQGQAEAAADAASGAANFFGSGGMIPGGMSKPIALADGAVINKPSVALIGEGKTNEAVVPLPNNREIPVDLKGASGDTINIEQSFDFTNANTDTIAALRTEARAIEERTFNRVFSEVNKGGKYAKIVGRR